MGKRVKVLFASVSEKNVPPLVQAMTALHPELPLYVVSEFPPPAGTPWIRWHPLQSSAGNAERIGAALAECDVALAGVALEPLMPYWAMRWMAFTRWPRQLVVFNEKMDHFMLRPRCLNTIVHHFYWRIRGFVRKQTRPGGELYTFLWRVRHPRAWVRPAAYLGARLSGAIARALRTPASTAEPETGLPAGVTVVIPSRNGRELLERLFASLLPEAPQEIIVVDNGSTDGTAEWLRTAYPGVQVEHSGPPLSFAAAVNRGIRRARNARTCLLNNDMVLEPGFFDALAAPFERVPGLFAATAQIFFPSGVRREETGKAMYHRNQSGQFHVWCEIPLEGEDGAWVLYGSGGCTLYDTGKLRALGGIGEQYTPAYVEDLDIGWRAWRRGWPTVFAAQAKVLHLHRSTTARYFTADELEDALERNYTKFAAGSNSAALWREALDRLNLLAARQEPVLSAHRALCGAWKQPWRQPLSAAGPDMPLALCGGAVAVFPGQSARGLTRVLVASPYPPFPLSHGGAVRMYNLMREAAKEFDQILLLFVDELTPPAPELLALCCEIILVRRRGSHLTPDTERPDVVEEHDQPEFRAALAATLHKWKPAIAQLEFTQMGLYAEACRPARTILVEHDITLDLYQQLLADKEDYDTRRQYRKWDAFEREAWSRVDAVVTMSEKDQATIGRPNAHVIRNGVDLTRFTPAALDPEPHRILFIGSFAHLPNVMAMDFFLREAWPLLRGHATLHIIAGQRHEYYLARYSGRVQLQLNEPGIVVEGFVSDVRAAYQQAAVVIAPLVASAGTNIKIMEAMAMRKAIVSTPAGINGLDLAQGSGVWVANSGEEMAAAIQRLLDNPTERRAMETAARRTVEEEYGWDRAGRVQSALYRTLAGTEKLHS
ncbi:MAG TPA: glycosyltransferase [Bryobacteraceae bacterium]|nr:glycosyltransferase [Bryobacteraceae bacterium]